MNDEGYCVSNCVLCGGLGFVPKSTTEDLRDPNFGKLDLCPNRYKKVFPDNIGITESEAHSLNLKKLARTTLVHGVSDAINRMSREGTGMMYLQGPPGVGKTVLMKAFLLWMFFRKRMVSALYINHSAMMDDLRSSFGKESKRSEYEDKINRYSTIRFMAIDEVGRDRDSAFAKASFGRIMDARYVMAKAGRGITILGSNFAPEETLDAYLVDRVRDKDNQVVAVSATTKSLRLTETALISDHEWWKREVNND